MRNIICFILLFVGVIPAVNAYEILNDYSGNYIVVRCNSGHESNVFYSYNAAANNYYWNGNYYPTLNAIAKSYCGE